MMVLLILNGVSTQDRYYARTGRGKGKIDRAGKHARCLSVAV